MKYDKQAALVSRLHKSTGMGKLVWTPSAREGAIQVSFPNYTVMLSLKDDIYYVELLNDEGETADVFSHQQLRNEPGPPGGFSWYMGMQDLYAMARRRAFGADQALDDILKDLDE